LVILLVIVCAAAAGFDVIESNVPQAYIGCYVGRRLSLYGDAAL